MNAKNVLPIGSRPRAIPETQEQRSSIAAPTGLDEPRGRALRSTALGLASGLIAASCSAFVGSHQPVTLDGLHPDTVILVDGEQVGTGRATVELERDRSHVVIFERAGTQDVRVIDHMWSIYGKLDVIGSIALLFPGLGLLCPGARTLQPRELTAELGKDR